jgi:hypothetical protein
MNEPIAAGTMCGGGETGVCNGLGACVGCLSNPLAGCAAGDYCYNATCASCTDGKIDGDETDVGCGGMSCPKCLAGKMCKVNTDCTTNNCVDGLCCTTACTDKCSSCTLPGLVGTCTVVPTGETTPACMGTSFCDLDACDPLGSMFPLGTPCNNSNYPMCATGACGGGLCKLPNGAPCARDIECESSLCSQNVCAKCTANAQCVSGTCNMTYSRCEQTEGLFCDNPIECLGMNCTAAGVCSLAHANGMVCTVSADCTSQLCKGNVCVACAGTTDCPSCSGGVCKAPSGAGCLQNSDCDSGQCVGAAPFMTCM